MSTPFGIKLAKRIKDEGFVDVKDFAQKSHIPIANVYKWTSGETVPRPYNVIRVAEAFGDDEEAAADWMRAAGYPGGALKKATETEQASLTILQDFPWIRSILPDLAAIPPGQQQIVVDLVRNLGRRDRGRGQ